MTTHRAVQISNLLDKVESMARICRTGSANLARIGNTVGSSHQLYRAQRFERIADKCKRRIGLCEDERNQLDWAIKQWTEEAEREEHMANYLDSIGQPYGSTDVYRVRADMARRTVTSLEIQRKTGIAVCSCHLKPFGEAHV